MSDSDPIELALARARSGKALIGWAAAICLAAVVLGNLVGRHWPIFLLAYWLWLPMWVYLDASQRASTKAWAFALLVLLTNVFGLTVYLVARPEGPLGCPSCGAPMKAEFRVCPHCGGGQRKRCAKCNQSLEEAWPFCPQCGEGQPTAQPTAAPNSSAAGASEGSSSLPAD